MSELESNGEMRTFGKMAGRVNWVQVAAIVVPLLTGLLMTYIQTERRVTVLEQQQASQERAYGFHVSGAGHQPLIDRLTALEQSRAVDKERWIEVKRTLDAVRADIKEQQRLRRY